MDLIEGRKYYLMTDESHFAEIDMAHFNSFEKHTFLRSRFHSSGHVSNVYVSYDFNLVGNLALEEVKTLNEVDVEQKVFKTKDEILKYLLTHVENLGHPYRLSKTLKNKVKKSQQRNPELWI